MSLDQTSLKHCIEDINRRIAEEYPRLTLIIIPFTHEKNPEDIGGACAAFVNHPAIDTIRAAFGRHIAPQKTPSLVVGLAQAKEKIFLSFLAKTFSIAGIWLKTDTLKNTDDVSTEIYHQLWHILKLQDDIQAGNTDSFKLKNDIYTSKGFGVTAAKNSLLADAFCAIMMELTGRKDMIQKHAKARCEMSFDRTAMFEAEQYPYPIALDAVQLVFKDMKDTEDGHQYNDHIALSLKMAKEIGLTCNGGMISQWQAFTTPAQNMLLSGIDIKSIMGAAIYTSEDAYNRSIAYLICDILNTEPSPIAHFEGYNPFADTEAQERIHNKMRDIAFESVKMREDSLSFKTCMQTAHKQCWAFINGNPVGWCAPAWIKTAHAIKSGSADTPESIFQTAAKDIDWLHVRTVHHGILEMRRQGEFPTLNTIVEIMRQEEDLRDMAVGIKELIDMFEEE